MNEGLSSTVNVCAADKEKFHPLDWLIARSLSPTSGISFNFISAKRCVCRHIIYRRRYARYLGPQSVIDYIISLSSRFLIYCYDFLCYCCCCHYFFPLHVEIEIGNQIKHTHTRSMRLGSEARYFCAFCCILEFDRQYFIKNHFRLSKCVLVKVLVNFYVHSFHLLKILN